jgi:hypothetical protein
VIRKASKATELCSLDLEHFKDVPKAKKLLENEEEKSSSSDQASNSVDDFQSCSENSASDSDNISVPKKKKKN